MQKNNEKPSEQEEFIEVDVEDEDTGEEEDTIQIDPVEEERKRIETEILDLIEKGKIDLLVEKYQNLSKLLAEESKLKKEYLNTAQLVQAEFENYKKRVHKDQEFSNYRNKANVLQKFLTIYEDIERIDFQTEKDSNIKTIKEALKLVYRNMKEALSDLGVKIIDPQDEIFDPKFHEAIYITEDDNLPNNKIVDVTSKGFILDNIVLKPARVVISKKPKKSADEANNS